MNTLGFILLDNSEYLNVGEKNLPKDIYHRIRIVFRKFPKTSFKHPLQLTDNNNKITESILHFVILYKSRVSSHNLFSPAKKSATNKKSLSYFL